ncbi:MAG: carbohydrate binding family 9 domain-containing protein [Flavobacteriaceae bacterium]|nr:carbohydrate binding family 9 domain-containing protein [Flavobacteriaceae bacterium]
MHSTLGRLILLFVFITGILHAQNTEPMRIARIEGIHFDGKVDEPAWDLIPVLPMVQYEPQAGAPPTEKTEIRIAYDDKYIYLSMRAFDSDPEGIRATSLYRDRIAGSDHLEVMLDTYNDNQTGYIFTTTPAGIRNDLSISNDGVTSTVSLGSSFNRDFNTFWDAESTVTDKGWFTEIRIPFSSLRFQETDGKVTMGFIVQRKIARKTERLVFPAVPPITNWAFLRPSMAQKIVFDGIKPRKTLYVTPYVLAGNGQEYQLNEPGTAYDKNTNSKFDVGGDVKFSITNNLTADFTVNTDFAQAEADDQLVNLTRFSLFFPEKRQFFLERASVFDFRIGGESRLFFSRRIGLTDTGERVPIYGGVRLVGRSKGWDLGLLDMQTQSLDTLASENFGVLRLRKQINKNSFIGGMFTSRIDTRGHTNMVYGLDGLLRVTGDDYLSVQWAQTFDSQNRADETADLKNGRLALELNRRRRQGFGYTLGVILSGENFNPGVGFVDRSAFKFGTLALSQTWLRDKGPFIWHTIQAFGNAYLNIADNNVLSSEYGADWSFSRRNLDNGSIKIAKSFEHLTDDFELEDHVVIPAGQYHFFRVGTNYTMAVDRTLRTGIGLDTGTFYDGWLHSLSLSPSWYISKYLQLNLDYLYNYGVFKNRDALLNFHVVRLRIGTALDRKLSVNTLVQYNGSQDLFSVNARFRYNFREGQDLWIVFNSGYNTDRGIAVPRLPAVNGQSILIKYLHTFIF